MKNLSIGQWVRFSRIAESVYIGDKKNIEHTEIESMFGVIIGKSYRQEGTYIKERKGGYSGFYGTELEDYEPPSLTVSRVIPLWQVRTGWRNSPIDVADEFLEIVDPCSFILPIQSKKPRRIIQPITVPAWIFNHG